MSKEANRIVNTIKSSKVDVFADKVEVQNADKTDGQNRLDEFTSCANKVIEQLSALKMYPVVMLLAAIDVEGVPTMFVGVLIPDRCTKSLQGSWLKSSIAPAQYPETKTFQACYEHDQYDLEIAEISFPTNSEHSPFKLTDQVRSYGFTFLRQTGVMKDDSSSEEEYGLDI